MTTVMETSTRQGFVPRLAPHAKDIRAELHIDVRSSEQLEMYAWHRADVRTPIEAGELAGVEWREYEAWLKDWHRRNGRA